MITWLFGALVLFCSIVGIGLSTNHYNAWAVVICSVAAIVALQLGYFATWLVKGI